MDRAPVGAGESACDPAWAELVDVGGDGTVDTPFIAGNLAELLIFGEADVMGDSAIDVTLDDLSLREAVAEAFRYRSRFRSAAGDLPGFAPTICDDPTDPDEYCYDPARIEVLRRRHDCLLELYRDWGTDEPSQFVVSGAYEYLEEMLAYADEGGEIRDGFERYYAELQIMLADDAVTRSFESRFDLDAVRVGSFPGAAFEQNGIELSGIPGFELSSLHEALQRYELVLERFYAVLPTLQVAIETGPPQTRTNFTSTAMVTTWLAAVGRAATQHGRAQAAVARRYQALGRNDLALRVAQRAYNAVYWQPLVFGDLLERLYEGLRGAQRAQLADAREQAERAVESALLDLRELDDELAGGLNRFGLPDGYVPFPALDANAELNGFDVVLATVRQKMDLARLREQAALMAGRDFDTDRVQFQNELARIAQTYEAQLAEVCGTFRGPGGVDLPATRRYADLDPRLASVGDPCGVVGTGLIHQAYGAVKAAEQEILRVEAGIDRIYREVEIEANRVSEYCGVIASLANYRYRRAGEEISLERDIAETQAELEKTERLKGTIEGVAGGLGNCDSIGGCIGTAISVGATIGTYAATEQTFQESQRNVADLEAQRAQMQAETARWETEQQCEMAQIDGDARMASIALGLAELRIGLAEATLQTERALSEVLRLRKQARRLQLEQEETLQMAIDFEAARNDPTVRILRNDAVLNADVAFRDALREVYRLTLIYEYYTSQSYGRLNDLFLVRLVGAGQQNLENYVAELENAFRGFEEEFGNPDVRVLVVSLRDDMLRIPRIDPLTLEPLAVNERANRLREALSSSSLLDPNGYLTVPFRTRLEDLSPATRNHKVLYIEANIEGNDSGDFLGRVWVRQNGTGIVRTVAGDLSYYAFPQRTAVIDAFFNSTREFAMSPEVYRNYRLRDRPLVNTGWELVFNQRDEVVNQDVNLGALTDIKLYIYYTDFTGI